MESIDTKNDQPIDFYTKQFEQRILLILHVLSLSTIHVSTKIMMSVCTHWGYHLIKKCRDINY